jgi:CRISPR/Cas system CSM-associated protein Csm5 (group 7 of RAMP superfamily)
MFIKLTAYEQIVLDWMKRNALDYTPSDEIKGFIEDTSNDDPWFVRIPGSTVKGMLRNLTRKKLLECKPGRKKKKGNYMGHGMRNLKINYYRIKLEENR